MSTTKYKLADQALRILSGGAIQNATETQVREMMIAVSQARDQVVWSEMFMLINQADNFDVPGEYITSYDDVEVKYDDKQKIMWAKLPAKPLNLPRNMGIYNVHLTEDMFNAFIPVSPNFPSLYRDLGASCLEDRIGYFYKRDKIFFVGMDKSDNIPTISLNLIVSATDVDDEDEVFPIPADKEMQVIQLALDMYGMQKQIPKDQINDNIDE